MAHRTALRQVLLYNVLATVFRTAACMSVLRDPCGFLTDLPGTVLLHFFHEHSRKFFAYLAFPCGAFW